MVGWRFIGAEHRRYWRVADKLRIVAKVAERCASFAAVAPPRGEPRPAKELAVARSTIDYQYDFGDQWEHRLTLTAVRQGEPGSLYPRNLAGEHARPPDCGGLPG